MDDLKVGGNNVSYEGFKSLIGTYYIIDPAAT